MVDAADNGKEKRLHLPKTIWQLGRERSIVVAKPSVAFLPGFGSFEDGQIGLTCAEPTAQDPRS